MPIRVVSGRTPLVPEDGQNILIRSLTPQDLVFHIMARHKVMISKFYNQYCLLHCDRLKAFVCSGAGDRIGWFNEMAAIVYQSTVNCSILSDHVALVE